VTKVPAAADPLRKRDPLGVAGRTAAPDREAMRRAVLLVALSLAAGCTHGASPLPLPLPLGKSDVALAAGHWRSPDGFAPALSFELADGWQSSHRYADFFDVGHAEPGKDAPRMAVAFSIAEETDAHAVLDGIVDAASIPRLETFSTRLAGRPATQFYVRHLDRTLYHSGNFGLESDRAGIVGIYVVQAAPRTVLVVAVIVPDAARWEGELYAGEDMLRSLRF
jgi:hypothetical protein